MTVKTGSLVSQLRVTVTTRHIDSEAAVVVYSGKAKRDVILGAEKSVLDSYEVWVQWGAGSSLKTEGCSRRSSRGFGRVGVLESGFLQEGNTRDLAPSTALHEGESTCSVGGAYR